MRIRVWAWSLFTSQAPRPAVRTAPLTRTFRTTIVRTNVIWSKWGKSEGAAYATSSPLKDHRLTPASTPSFIHLSFRRSVVDKAASSISLSAKSLQRTLLNGPLNHSPHPVLVANLRPHREIEPHRPPRRRNSILIRRQSPESSATTLEQLLD